MVGFGGLILHYHNGQWQIAASGQQNHTLLAVAALSDGEAWAVGSIDSTQSLINHSLMMHEQNGTWQTITAPVTDPLQCVSFDAPTDGWIGTANGKFLHYDGAHWTEAATQSPLSITSISMISPTDGWAVSNGDMYHYDGASWQIDSDAGFYTDENVATLPDGEAWATGSVAYGNNDPAAVGAQLFHEQGGVWSPVAGTDKGTIGDITEAVLALQSPTEGWLILSGTNTRVQEINGVWMK